MTQELEEWKGEIFDRTQGNVDIDRDHPNLGRYLGPGFFADKEWWDKAREIFTDDENEELNRGFTNYFSPETILFADESEESRRYFEILMDHDISLRVLPIDEHIDKPTVGLILLDLLYIGESKVAEFAERWLASKTRLSEVIERESPELGLKYAPDFHNMMKKVRQIQIDRAIVEMSRITSTE